MDIIHRRTGAFLLALCCIAAGALFAAPGARAATCQEIPVDTIGTDFTIGEDEYRVPAVKNITLCVDSGFVPIPSISFDGRGICEFACLSITIPAGDLDAPGLTISYDVDDVHETQAINPAGASGLGPACILSVGGPDAPYTPCPPGVSFGPDINDPTAGVLTAVQDQVEAAEQTVVTTVNGAVATAEQAVADALELAGAIVGDAGAAVQLAIDTVESLRITTCDAMPPMYEYDQWGNVSAEVRLCDEPVRWGTAAVTALSKDSAAVAQMVLDTAEALGDTACNQVPPMYEYDQWGNVSREARFCNDPVGWTTILAVSLNDDVEALEALVVQLIGDAETAACNAVPPMYEYDEWGNFVREVRFCDEPVAWTTIVTNDVTKLTCSAIPPMYDEWGQEVRFCNDPVRWSTIALDDATTLACQTVPSVYDEWGNEYRFCDDPVGWTITATNIVTRIGCNAIPPVYDEWGQEVRFCNDPVRWTAIVLRPFLEDVCIQPSQCTEPIDIKIILDRLKTHIQWA